MVVFNTDKIDFVINAINSLKAATGDWLTGFCITLQDEIKEPICPICKGNVFNATDNSLTCVNDHFKIDGVYFYKSLIKDPFEIKKSPYKSDFPYEVFYDEEFNLEEAQKQKAFSRRVKVAETRYIYNEFKKERSIIVNRTAESSDIGYFVFVKYLKDNLCPLFTIIEKINHDVKTQ